MGDFSRDFVACAIDCLTDSHHPERRLWLTQAACLLAASAVPSAFADTAASYPTKPVRIVVPFAPGGATDVLARVTGNGLAAQLKQPVIIENRPGGAGLIGGDVVAKATPDGHNLYLGTTSTMLSMQFLFKKMPFDPQTNFAPVSRICWAPIVLVVNSELPVHTVNQLVEYIRANKGRLSYGSYGIGSHAHLAFVTLDKLANGGMTHIAYKGEAPMTQELVGGSLKMGMGSTLSLKQHIESGKLRALAFTGAHRVPALQDIPTFEEAGFKQEALRISGWLGVVATGGTPPEIVQKIGQAFRSALTQRDVNARVLTAGFVPLSDDTPQKFAKNWIEEMAIWKRLLHEADVQPN
ncbi:Bug family tripartite tricarboxylate transporter substrate binding protein [Comamonas sp. NoAH]|uniref:Bug family tripartite tricarboxylate transporter substrate binding protein n=1 Tax=Comamonas halotolerans TaxID=3041496 RepID=UPI0024E14C4C|nr:tripartite tricarboxylate transporter substrate binding protein [Comamonas sp. NoAH]